MSPIWRARGPAAKKRTPTTNDLKLYFLKSGSSVLYAKMTLNKA